MKNTTLLPAAVIVAVTIGMTSIMPHNLSAQDSPTTLAKGLNGPMGILAAPDGAVWVVDSGVGGDQEMQFPNVNTYELTTVTVGRTSRIIRVAPDGSQTELATLPSMVVGPGEVVGGGRLAVVDGAVYATSGVWIAGGEDDPWPLMASIIRIDEGEATEIANTYAIESELNPDGGIAESNPYGLTAGKDGMLWIADAGANSLLKLDPETGDLEIVAVFDALPSPLPNPNRDNRLESDPVPTAVAFDDEGNAYVSLLPGFPFIPGSAKVVKVGSDGEITDYATGLTMLVDLRRGPDGNMYAVSLGQFTEQGPVPESGAIVRIREGGASQEILTGLSFPTSIDFNETGDAYVTLNGIGAPGTGEVVIYSGLAVK